MVYRNEEKYLLDYRQYAILKSRAQAVLNEDENSIDGGYFITSLYFDDIYHNAYYEKEDGLISHTKFRLRNYNFSDSVLKLERKLKIDKKTHKINAKISLSNIIDLVTPPFELDNFKQEAADIVTEMKHKGVFPTVIVRYWREAFLLPGSDARLTFDLNVNSLSPDVENLFAPNAAGIPVLHPSQVIMEVKYSQRLPNLFKSICGINSHRIAVSKYAMCKMVR